MSDPTDTAVLSISPRLSDIVSSELGTPGVVYEFGPAKNLQEALGCTSLQVVSIQMAIEEEFGLVFATGATDRGPIDAEWDACRSMHDLDVLVRKWTKP